MLFIIMPRKINKKKKEKPRMMKKSRASHTL
jgi:hypothetical protein